jgi:diguanylate cyclase (GGDEF)-like protein/PAS domain S-box-containing protein
MRELLRSSLRVRLVLVILSTCAIALALACAAVAGYEYTRLRSSLVARLGALAGVVGENSRAAVAFQDRRSAETTLAALEADPRVLRAALYDADGRIFARYARPGEAREFPIAPRAGGEGLAGRRVGLLRPIAFEGERVGTVYLVADLSGFDEQLGDFARASAAILVLALLAAGLLGYRLQRVVSDPVLRLAAAARSVSDGHDYTVRVPPAGGDEIGQLTTAFNGMLDQIERRDAELRESEERYQLAVRGTQEGVWDWDLVAETVHYSPRWHELLGYEAGELSTRPEEWLERVHPEDFHAVHRAIDDHRSGRSPQLEIEHRLRRRDGTWIWARARALAVLDEDGRARRMAGSLSDVTEQKGRDPLTGLPNRMLFVDRLDRALERAQRRGRGQLAVLCLELERMQPINDVLGRAAGRELLVAAARRIRAALDRGDTLARLDAAEFAILVDELADASRAARVARRIHAALAPGFRLLDQEVFTGAAIGIATSAGEGELAEQLLADAHTALVRAREAGWGESEVFDERMRERALAQLDLENDLRRALERDELEVHFQPIVALDGRRLAGFEALARWRRAGGTFVPPAEFIGVAEEIGIIVPLGSWVLREALRNLRDWRDRDAAAADLVLSVNVSARQVARPELAADVLAALDESGVPADRLKLEITESSLVEPDTCAGEVLREIQRAGVGIWLDDFGTGYSSLSYLHRLPLEALKIDRSFVQSLNGDPERKGIVRSVVALARDLGLKTVAEGVETTLQMERVTSLRCDFVQGHAVSLPLAAPAVGRLLGAPDS